MKSIFKKQLISNKRLIFSNHHLIFPKSRSILTQQMKNYSIFDYIKTPFNKLIELILPKTEETEEEKIAVAIPELAYFKDEKIEDKYNIRNHPNNIKANYVFSLKHSEFNWKTYLKLNYCQYKISKSQNEINVEFQEKYETCTKFVSCLNEDEYNKINFTETSIKAISQVIKVPEAKILEMIWEYINFKSNYIKIWLIVNDGDKLPTSIEKLSYYKDSYDYPEKTLISETQKNKYLLDLGIDETEYQIKFRDEYYKLKEKENKKTYNIRTYF